jgi:hypothetical protein
MNSEQQHLDKLFMLVLDFFLLESWEEKGDIVMRGS